MKDGTGMANWIEQAKFAFKPCRRCRQWPSSVSCRDPLIRAACCLSEWANALVDGSDARLWLFERAVLVAGGGIAQWRLWMRIASPC